jgi:hypothetical protein
MNYNYNLEQEILDDLYDCMFKDYFEDGTLCEFSYDSIKDEFGGYRFSIGRNLRFGFWYQGWKGNMEMQNFGNNNFVRKVVDFLNKITSE